MQKHELSKSYVNVDVRLPSEKLRDFAATQEGGALCVFAFAALSFGMPHFVEAWFILGIAMAIYVIRLQRARGLPMKIPKSSGVMDPNNLNLENKPQRADGIFFLGNDAKTGAEIWLSDTQARTHMLFMGTTGSGKAQPHRAMLLTPRGWVRMGDIRQGDIVSTPDGSTARVLKVFPQGRKQIYRVTLADGRATEACADHLWSVLDGKDRSVISTAKIAEMIRAGERPALPIPAAMQGIHVQGLDAEEMGVSLAHARLRAVEPIIECGERCAAQGQAEFDGAACAPIVSADILHASVEQRARFLRAALGAAEPVDSVRQHGDRPFTRRPVPVRSIVVHDRDDADRVVYVARSLGGSALRSGVGAAGDSDPRWLVEIGGLDDEKLQSLIEGNARKEVVFLDVAAIEPVDVAEASCIYIDHPQHLYVTDDFIVTHNTEFLISLTYNAIIHGSGFIYVDGKADSSLYSKIYSMARSAGREDDILVINFQTGARDIWGAQSRKMSNTVNPFAVGSSGMLSQLVMGLIETGKSDIWSERANSFVEALMKPLVFLRDRHGLLLDVNVIRDYFSLDLLEDLAWLDANKYEGLDDTLSGIRAFLTNLPGYRREAYHKQGETVHEQFGFVVMQLVRTFNSLSDTYGYIMKTPLAEIDFVDVFLNRRILIVLLPALEKSPSELTNLGRIIVAAIKATMAVGLGPDIEGETKKIIHTRPTTAPSPFCCVLDEWGFYAVRGFSVVPAQARSLGFSAIFAGQDLPAFEKASKEEAESTLANTNTKLCGKLECVKTYKYFSDLASKAHYTVRRSFQRDRESDDLIKNWQYGNDASIDYADKVTLGDLKGQRSGEWHLFFANKLIKIRSFFANPKEVKNLRVNHMIKVAPPSLDEIEAYKKVSKAFDEAMANANGMTDVMDTVITSELMHIRLGAQSAKSNSPLERVTAGMGCWMADVMGREHFAPSRPASSARPDDEPVVDDDADDGSDAGAADIPNPETFDFVGATFDGMDLARPNTVETPTVAPTRSLRDAGGAGAALRGGALPSALDEDGQSDPAATEGGDWDDEFAAPRDPRDAAWSREDVDFSSIKKATVFGIGADGRASDTGEDEDKTAPARGGVLEREATVAAVANIERRLGASRDDGDFRAQTVAGKLADVTKYPPTLPPSSSTEALETVANRLKQALQEVRRAGESTL